ncbi:MAG: hypothetical protein AB8B99_12245 [Phormidesmis sp.]
MHRLRLLLRNEEAWERLALLGFAWDAEGVTGIDMHDSFYVLVFVQGNEVVAHTKMARDER